VRILFVNPKAYLPQLLGGVETTTYDLVEHLAGAGHSAAVMCHLARHDWLWARNRIASRLHGIAFPADEYRGTRVYRGYEHAPALAEVLADFRPERLVIMGGSERSFELAQRCLLTGVRTLFYFHELVALRRDPGHSVPAGMPVLANSHYTARAVRELLNREAVAIPPLVDPARYRVPTSRTHVTMINPRGLKGGETAVELARACPDIPFQLIEAWRPDDTVPRLRAAARQLPNVTWRRPTNDMLRVYATTRILLVPSTWEETWGRVVTEAQASGIPALARAVAALPESVGPAGLLVAQEAPLEAWVQALRSMWDDTSRYQSLVAQAFAFAQRPEAQPAQRVAAFLAALG
jgi:glycosyltransferase involved in cell wall biosynthesis